MGQMVPENERWRKEYRAEPGFLTMPEATDWIVKKHLGIQNDQREWQRQYEKLLKAVREELVPFSYYGEKKTRNKQVHPEDVKAYAIKYVRSSIES